MALSMWIGALLCVSILSVRSPFKDCTPRRAYFGKMGTFLFIGLGQALLMSLTMMLLGVQYTSFAVLFLTLLGIGWLFMIIVYSLVSLLGNVGKFIAIIIMVFQVGATGGIFPIEVVSQPLQILSAYLPVTYAVDALRQVIVNTNVTTILKNLGIIAIGSGAMVLLTVTLKNKVQVALDKMHELTQESALFD
jgi:putative membrane protein